MDPREAAALIRPAVPGLGGIWADLGAGTGTFTRALATLLGSGGRVYAMDRDPHAIAVLQPLAATRSRGGTRTAIARATVEVIEADFADLTRALDLPALDGALLANALHFVREPGPVLARIATVVRPGGRVVVVEYDNRPASRWLPYPLSLARLSAIAERAGLDAPTLVGTRPSAYGGTLYATVALRPAREGGGP